MRIVIITSLFLLTISCKQREQKKINNKVLNFTSFEITVPNTWKKINIDGIDSQAGGIVTTKNDTILFDLGKYVSKIDMAIPVNNIKEKDTLRKSGFSVDEMYFSKTPSLDKNQGTFHNEFYYYDTINSLPAKVQVPKFIGKGTLKIYFDSIDTYNNRFSMFTRNIDTTNHYEVLKAFQTILFKSN
ncbi:hypothetical protein [Aquimarina sp. I32.4]|uniref:hypothetical protein n=1 Tax=Aquimarina sp. I32.4 TaxID=2053903 RepID=UPI0011AF306D|nr:hypothetical protein [Aquimarina sp. I32.4]